MKAKLFLTALMTAAALAAGAQDTPHAPETTESCRCSETFEWLRSTFETNDAGFGYVVERKGRAAYDLHNQMTLQKIRAVGSERECRTLMTDWLAFFRRGHIGFYRLPPATTAAPATPTAPTTDPRIESYIRSRSARAPYIERLNPTTLYLRIPSFDHRQKAAIDRLIADNFTELTSTENLIVDVRGNGGGSDISYSELSPLLYTDPVRTPSVSFLSTPLNIEKTEALLAIPEIDEVSRGEITALVESMRAHPGEFVPMGDDEVDIETRDTVYAYPRRVGILVDGGCASTTEQFLLAARQSRKAKLFGTTTSGMLDASNVRTVDSPDGRYRLSYTTSLSARVPGLAIDDIGLQPDYYLDPTIPDCRWVEHVNEALNR